MEERLRLLKVRQFSDVLNDSISFARKYIGPVGYAILVLVVPVYVLGSFIYSNNIAGLLRSDHTQTLFNFKKILTGGSIGIFILMIGRLLLTVIFISAFLHIEHSETGEIEPKDIFSDLKHNFWRLIGFYLLAILIAGIIAALTAMVFVALASAAATGLLVILGMLFVIGLIYLSVSLAFTPIIYMREMCGFGEAISRSMYLVKKNWWWTFLILFVGGIIGAMGEYVFTLPYTILMAMKTFSSSHGGHTGFELNIADRVALTFSNFGSIISTSIVTIVTFIQYYSLVEKKDGVNLMQQIDNIGASENSSY